MERLSIAAIIDKIEREVPFCAVASDGSFTIKVDSYVHYVCAAVHDGHQFRKNLWDNCLHTEYDRWYEEDPCTKYFVKTHPIVIAGRDSRFEYDLNRDPETAVYEAAWGKELWEKPLEQKVKDKSLEKHTNFYKVVHTLLNKLKILHRHLIVYDMHSYNWQRWERPVPVINLGTSNIDNDRYSAFVHAWCDTLQTIQIPDVNTTAAINDTFQGNGYFLKYITANFENTLVLATEFSKIYCDELSEIIYPEVVAAIETQLRTILKDHAYYFLQEVK
ncbi:MAG: N-formylglutamate amidohydrolase [Leeuwenhoekiella sp.]